MDLLTWAVMAFAVLLFGISKGGFGGGVGIFSVPLMAFVISTQLAAAVLLPILLVMDVVIVYRFWRQWDTKETILLCVSGIIGVGVGTLLFGVLDEDGLKILLGLLCLIFCGLWLLRKIKNTEDQRLPYNPIKGGFWGALGGFASFVAHAGSPPVNIYLLPRKLEKTVYQATVSMAFAVINFVKVAPFIMLGSITMESFLLSIYLLPVGILGVVLGFIAHKKLDEKRFYVFIYICLALIGVRLLQDGISGLFLA